jgi:hypothetical protein
METRNTVTYQNAPYTVTISQYGNTTLAVQTSRTLREVWSIV